jgi:maltose O-acetyltransferase
VLNLWNLWVNDVAALHCWPRWMRRRMLRVAGIQVGSGTIVAGGCFFGSRRIQIGASCYVGPGCFFDGSDDVRLHDRVNIAFGVTVTTSTHEPGTAERRAGAARSAPVAVGEGSWVGAKATLLPGVTLGDGCIVGAGALVTRSCGDSQQLVGVPARSSDIAA